MLHHVRVAVFDTKNSQLEVLVSGLRRNVFSFDRSNRLTKISSRHQNKDKSQRNNLMLFMLRATNKRSFHLTNTHDVLQKCYHFAGYHQNNGPFEKYWLGINHWHFMIAVKNSTDLITLSNNASLLRGLFKSLFSKLCGVFSCFGTLTSQKMPDELFWECI